MTAAISFGELLWDCFPDTNKLGGAPANLAFHLNQLGIKAKLLSRIGDDQLGREALTFLSNRNCDISLIQVDKNKATGTVNVKLDSVGHPAYTIVKDVAYDFIEFSSFLEKDLDTTQLVCFGTLAQRSERSRETLASLLSVVPSALKLLDLNLRKDCYSNDIIEQSLEYADILKLNDEEARFLGELFDIVSDDMFSVAESLIEKFALKVCMITLGADGAIAVGANSERAHVLGRKVEVADTVGAGDSFTAGFIYKYLGGASLEESSHFANSLGALVASKPGAMPELSAEEIINLKKM